MFLLSLFMLLCSCGDKIEVSGHRVDQLRELSGYTEIQVTSGIKVVLNQSEKESVSVKTFESVQKYIKCFVQNGVLYVEMEKGLRFKNDINVIVTIGANNIKRVSLSGGVVATSSTKSFFDPVATSLDLSGGSSLTGDMATGDLNIDISGGGSVRLTGKSTTLNMSGSGGSKLEAVDFSTDILDIELSGGARCEINVNDRINRAYLSGGSRLLYRGTRIVNNVNVSGGSELINRN